MEGTKHLESLVRAIRSTGPKELLLKLAVNRAELQQQLHAVLIQAVYRGHRGRQRVHLLRRRLAIFNRTTQQVSDIIVEQFILQTSLDLAINFHRVNARYHRLRESLEEGMVQDMECLVREVLQEESQKVIEEVVLNASEILLNVRKRQLLSQQQQMLALQNDLLARDYLAETSNPVIGVLMILLNEECRFVAIETLLESSRMQLINSHAQRITPAIIDEVVYVEALRALLNEFSLIEEKQFMSQTISLLEKEEIKDCVLCDRSVRFLKRQREQLTHNIMHSDNYNNSNSYYNSHYNYGNTEELFSETAATLVSQNVSQAMLTTLLKRHETQYDPLIAVLSEIGKSSVSQGVSPLKKHETAFPFTENTNNINNNNNNNNNKSSAATDVNNGIDNQYGSNNVDNIKNSKVNNVDNRSTRYVDIGSMVGSADRERAVDKLRRLTSLSNPSSKSTSPRINSKNNNNNNIDNISIVDLGEKKKIASLLFVAQDLVIDDED